MIRQIYVNALASFIKEFFYTISMNDGFIKSLVTELWYQYIIIIRLKVFQIFTTNFNDWRYFNKTSFYQSTKWNSIISRCSIHFWYLSGWNTLILFEMNYNKSVTITFLKEKKIKSNAFNHWNKNVFKYRTQYSRLYTEYVKHHSSQTSSKLILRTLSN